MNTLFVEQVQYLMQLQQINQNKKRCANMKYSWLCDRKVAFKYLSSKQEHLLQQALNNVNEVDKVRVLNQVRDLLETERNIPETAINILNELKTENHMQLALLSRMSSFRNSLRRLTSMPNNRIVAKPKRSVSLNDHPAIFSISK